MFCTDQVLIESHNRNKTHPLYMLQPFPVTPGIFSPTLLKLGY